MMTPEMQEKYVRMNKRLTELEQINGNIARLAFDINENYMTDAMYDTLKAQLKAMVRYRNLLQTRIIDGLY